MNCPNCGNMVQNGAPFCPFCNTPLSQSYSQQSYGYQQPGYPQQNGYPAPGYPQQYGQNSYPTAYQQPYVYGEQQKDPMLASLSELPRQFLQSFRAPSEVLLGLVEKNDTLSAAVVGGIVLLLTFFAGMAMSHGTVKAIVELFASLAGVSMGGMTGSASQGISLIAERISASVGGIAVLCQLLFMLIPIIVFCVYLNLIRKNPFSWTVLLSLITVASFPSAVAAVLCMICSFISPVLSLLVIVCSIAFSYLQLGNMLDYITGLGEDQMFVPKAVILCVSLLLTLVIVFLVGGSLLGNVFQNIIRMLSSGSLL